jgi:hypothetical protein
MSLLRSLFSTWVLFAIAMLISGPAPAQTRDRAAGEALFRAGREAAEAGDHATACKRFEESNRLDPALGTLFNIADCREKLGRLASAWQAFQEVAQRLGPGDERGPIAEARAAALEPRLPRLVLQLSPGAPVGTVVLREEVELGTGSLGVPLPVDPGRHVVTVRAPGRAERRYDVVLEEGKATELTLEVGEPAPGQGATAATSTPTSPPPDLPASGGSSRTAGFVVGGIGVASVIAGVVTGGLALRYKSKMDDHCSDGVCDQTGFDAADKGDTFAKISTVTFAVGAVGIGLGTYLLLSSDDEGRQVGIQATPNALFMRGRF